jgi:carboxymethylenebutenolidase
MLERIESRWIPLQGGQPACGGYLALPPAGHGPGLVLFQEIFGVNAHIRAVAQQYALDGFVVLAPDIFWRQAPQVQLGYEGEDRERGIALMKQLRPEEMRSDIEAAVATLRGLPQTQGQRVGAIGYCLGGRLAYFAAAHTDVDAAVAYYGGGIQDHLGAAAGIRAPMLFHYAENDAGIPLEAVERVRAAMGERARVHVYPGAAHGFNCWDRSAYEPRSAALAHGRTLQFLAESLYPAA